MGATTCRFPWVLESTENFVKHFGATPPRELYVAAHEVTSSYGGPEEGGWWYDVGTVLNATRIVASIDPAETVERLREEYTRVYDRLMPLYGEESTRHLTTGEPDLSVSISDERPCDYPATRPHYE